MNELLPGMQLPVCLAASGAQPKGPRGSKSFALPSGETTADKKFSFLRHRFERLNDREKLEGRGTAIPDFRAREVFDAILELRQQSRSVSRNHMATALTWIGEGWRLRKARIE
jgi:hypothetical protein